MLSEEWLRETRAAVRASPEAERTVLWLLLCRAVEAKVREQQWIPVSERQPDEEQGEVLALMEDGSCGRNAGADALDAAAATASHAGGQMIIDVDALAQEIRRIDGNHSLGAAALAEALMPFLQEQMAERKPLTDEEIDDLIPNYQQGWTRVDHERWIARAVERAHGIGITQENE